MEVLNETGWKIDEDRVKRIVEFVLEREGKEGEVSIAFVGKEKMRELNEKFRGKDYPTDVLTFPYGDEMLGEIIVCPEVVAEDAKEYGISFEKELLITLVHSALHLCGYDHERDPSKAEEMFRKQDEYVKELEGIL